MYPYIIINVCFGFFFATWLFVFEKMKRNMKHCDLRGFGPLFKMKIIKLTTSKPIHFWKNAITHLGQLPFNGCNHNQMSQRWQRTQGLHSFLWSFSLSHRRTFGMKYFALCYYIYFNISQYITNNYIYI